MSDHFVNPDAPTHREMIEYLIRLYGNEVSAAKALKQMLEIFGGDRGRTVITQQTLNKWKNGNRIPGNKALTFCAAAQWKFMPWQVCDKLYPRRLLQRLCTTPDSGKQMVGIAESMLLLEQNGCQAADTRISA